MTIGPIMVILTLLSRVLFLNDDKILPLFNTKWPSLIVMPDMLLKLTGLGMNAHVKSLRQYPFVLIQQSA